MMHVRTQLALVLAVTALPAIAAADSLVQPKPGAHASLTLGGPWLVHPSPPPLDSRSETELVEDHGNRVLVRIFLDGGSLQLYLDSAGLATVTISETELHATDTPGALGARDAGAKLERGVPIDDATPQPAGTTRVAIRWQWDGATIELHGIVGTAILGTRFEPKVVTPDQRKPPSRPDHQLPATFELQGAPGGKVFVSRRGKGPAAVTAIATSGAFTLVQLERQPEGVITGWIASKLVAAPTSTPVEPSTYGMLADPTTPVDIYDARGGNVVGKLWDTSRFKAVAHVDGWTRYDLATIFGVATVWAR
jgi:hypothetical protein